MVAEVTRAALDEWRFPNQATPLGSAAYYSLRFAPRELRDDSAVLSAWRYRSGRSQIGSRTLVWRGLPELLAPAADRARTNLAVSDPDRGLPVCIRIWVRILVSLLDELKGVGFAVADRRIGLTPLRKLWLAWQPGRRAGGCRELQGFASPVPARTSAFLSADMENYQPNPDLLAGRVVLVTGAAEGIGRAVAVACARHSAALILSDREQHDLNLLYDELEASGAPEPAILTLDPERVDEKDLQRAVGLIDEEFGCLDGLVHCVAFAPFLSRIDDYDASEWERVLRINLTAPFLLTQACLPLLRAANDASVIFTLDRIGRRGAAYWGAYCAAKFGIEGLMQTLAEETRDNSNIRVNGIDPGVVRTGLRTRLYPGENPARLPGAETVTGSYLYLLGPDAMGVIGQRLSL